MYYLTGDMHGDESRIYDNEWYKLKPGDTLIVLGDFGFLWDGSEREKKAISFLATRKFTIAFLDGTHENFDMINSCRMTRWKGGKVHRIGPNLYHMMRGEIFDFDGCRVFAMGGGESDDIDIRKNQSWWRDELPTPQEMAVGAEALDEENLYVDYILTHEPPSLIKSAMLLRKGRTDKVNKLNGYFNEIDRSCSFRHWYFGSMHEDRTVTPKHTCVFNKIIPLDTSPVKLPAGKHEKTAAAKADT